MILKKCVLKSCKFYWWEIWVSVFSGLSFIRKFFNDNLVLIFVVDVWRIRIVMFKDVLLIVGNILVKFMIWDDLRV